MTGLYNKRSLNTTKTRTKKKKKRVEIIYIEIELINKLKLNHI